MRQKIKLKIINLVYITHLVINERSEGQIVKEVREVLPDICVAVLAQTLIVETIHLRDLATLVIAS